jgi:SAM-dependent methyltransferase
MSESTAARAGIRACPACGGSDATPAGAENGWALARCPRCLVRFTSQLPQDDELAALYERLYSQGDAYQMHLDEIRALRESRAAPKAGIHRSLIFLRRYTPEPGDRLLDVGCGVGTFLMAARARGWDAEGTDLSQTAVEASRAVHQIPVKVGSFFDLDFPSHEYQAITAWEVLEHLPDPRAFLEKVRTLLKPGGIFACSVPNESAKVPQPEVRGPASVPPVHLSFWDREALRRFFQINGFRPERMLTQRTMLSCVVPRADPLRFARVQAGALVGRYEGQHLFAAVRPATNGGG